MKKLLLVDFGGLGFEHEAHGGVLARLVGHVGAGLPDVLEVRLEGPARLKLHGVANF